jgi:FKBP-type peptidyl-prolyl cis-trans isomerase (trigger factor)
MNDTPSTKPATYQQCTVEKQPHSEIIIAAEIPTKSVEVFRRKALKSITEKVELPGFRRGHVPEDVVVKHVGEQAILEEAAELAIAAAYRDIVTDKTLEVVGRPQVTVTKLAPGNPIGFKIQTAVFPAVSLPDYKRLAEEERKQHADPELEVVSDNDVDLELARLQRMLAGAHAQGEDAVKDDTALPPLDDAFARSLGEFADLPDLKKKVRAQLHVEKKRKAHDKRRIAIADKIIAKTKVELPEVFVQGELDQMVADFSERVRRAGMELEAYLKQADKTLDGLRKEWRTDAEKRATLQLVLAEIAKKENLVLDHARLDREVAHLQEHYPDAEPGALRAYATSYMQNELVFAMLEGRDPVLEEHDHDHGHA